MKLMIVLIVYFFSLSAYSNCLKLKKSTGIRTVDESACVGDIIAFSHHAGGYEGKGIVQSIQMERPKGLLGKVKGMVKGMVTDVSYEVNIQIPEGDICWLAAKRSVPCPSVIQWKGSEYEAIQTIFKVNNLNASPPIRGFFEVR